MKKIILYFLILVAGVFQSCQKADSPKKVAEKFLTAMSNRNYEEAGKYATKETKKLLQQLQKIDELSGLSDDLKPDKVTIVSEEIQGKSAVVYFKEEGNDLEQKITLKKVEVRDSQSEWQVALKKEEIRLNRDPGLDLQQKEEKKPAKLPS